MKVSIIGGGGLVGSMAAYALHLGKIASHICILDANAQVAEGVALDILQGTSLVADQRVTAGTIEKIFPTATQLSSRQACVANPRKAGWI